MSKQRGEIEGKQSGASEGTVGGRFETLLVPSILERDVERWRKKRGGLLAQPTEGRTKSRSEGKGGKRLTLRRLRKPARESPNPTEIVTEGNEKLGRLQEKENKTHREKRKNAAREKKPSSGVRAEIRGKSKPFPRAERKNATKKSRTAITSDKSLVKEGEGDGKDSRGIPVDNWVASGRTPQKEGTFPVDITGGKGKGDKETVSKTPSRKIKKNS